MASNKPTDELLAALADVGLGLWMMDGANDHWHVDLFNVKLPMSSPHYVGEGESPAVALIAALAAAGVVVTDE